MKKKVIYTICIIYIISLLNGISVFARTDFLPEWPLRNGFNISALDVYQSGGAHSGIDVGHGNKPTQNVYAVADGIVTNVKNFCSHYNQYPHKDVSCNAGNLGNFVTIKHTVNGKVFYSQYGHLTKDSITVNIGQRVSSNTVIGKMGSSGNSTGPHLHFSICENGYTANRAKRTFDFYKDNIELMQTLRIREKLAKFSVLYGDWIKGNGTLKDGLYYFDDMQEDYFNSDSPRHAPNMYVDWITSNAYYDVVSVDWYCDKDATDTYWAVHNWDSGYAGFQNKDGKHVLLLSLWDIDGKTPKIEYVLDGEHGSFGGEGTGKQVFTNYNWKVGKWYSMCIQISSDNNKSYYAQYIKEENGDWIKTAVISYPVRGDRFYSSSMFQEDFTFNNYMRSCRLRNACGRLYGTENWESWNTCRISNSFFPTDDATWENGVQNNVKFDCDWENYGDYVWVQSGGKGFSLNHKQIPVQCTINNSSIPPKSFFGKQDEPSKEAQKMTIDDGIYTIATMLDRNYVLDIDGAGKADGDNLQLWENNGTEAQAFKVSYEGNGYYQIVNVNSGKAIDVANGDTTNGTNVWQYEINGTDAQLWKIVSSGNGSYYIIGKGSGLYLDVENAVADSGTNIQIFERNDGYDAQKWCFVKHKTSTTTSKPEASTSIKILLDDYPTGKLPYGKSFSLSGKFTSDSAIVEARAYMLDSNKNVIMEAKASSTTSNYKIQGYKLDKGMKFDELSPGGYYLKYFVKDADGDTATWMSDMFYIVK